MIFPTCTVCRKISLNSLITSFEKLNRVETLEFVRKSPQPLTRERCWKIWVWFVLDSKWSSSSVSDLDCHRTTYRGT